MPISTPTKSSTPWCQPSRARRLSWSVSSTASASASAAASMISGTVAVQ
jgi:hypothetical protein